MTEEKVNAEPVITVLDPQTPFGPSNQDKTSNLKRNGLIIAIVSIVLIIISIPIAYNFLPKLFSSEKKELHFVAPDLSFVYASQKIVDKKQVNKLIQADYSLDNKIELPISPIDLFTSNLSDNSNHKKLSISPDGKYLVVKAKTSVAVANVADKKKPKIIIKNDKEVKDFVFSTDGRKIIYQALDKTFSTRTYIINVDGTQNQEIKNPVGEKALWGVEHIQGFDSKANEIVFDYDSVYYRAKLSNNFILSSRIGIDIPKSGDHNYGYKYISANLTKYFYVKKNSAIYSYDINKGQESLVFENINTREKASIESISPDGAYLLFSIRKPVGDQKVVDTYFLKNLNNDNIVRLSAIIDLTDTYNSWYWSRLSGYLVLQVKPGDYIKNFSAHTIGYLLIDATSGKAKPFLTSSRDGSKKIEFIGWLSK